MAQTAQIKACVWYSTSKTSSLGRVCLTLMKDHTILNKTFCGLDFHYTNCWQMHYGYMGRLCGQKTKKKENITWLCRKWQPISYIVHYFVQGP